MNSIIKICKKHGSLTIDQVRQKGKSPNGQPYYQCLYCKSENAKNYRKNNLDTIKEKQYVYDNNKKNNTEWREKRKSWIKDYQKRRRNDPKRREEFLQKQLEHKRKYFEKNHDSILERQRDNSYNLKMHYVRWYLKKHYGFENPPNELIEAKAELMRLRREIMIINVNRGKNKYVSKTKKYRRGYERKDDERNFAISSKENS